MVVCNCAHNSRVGDKTRHFGKRLALLGLFKTLFIIGMPKAKVLPLPVIALKININFLKNFQKKNLTMKALPFPIKSFPSKVCLRVASCIGNGLS
jgi:hypothetical protein